MRCLPIFFAFSITLLALLGLFVPLTAQIVDEAPRFRLHILDTHAEQYPQISATVSITEMNRLNPFALSIKDFQEAALSNISVIDTLSVSPHYDNVQNPLNIILALDRSFLTHKEAKWAELQTIAKEIQAGLRPNDELSLVVFAKQAEKVERLDDIQPDASHTALHQAIMLSMQKAVEWHEINGRQSVIFVIADRFDNTWDRQPSLETLSTTYNELFQTDPVPLYVYLYDLDNQLVGSDKALAFIQFITTINESLHSTHTQGVERFDSAVSFAKDWADLQHLVYTQLNNLRPIPRYLLSFTTTLPKMRHEVRIKLINGNADSGDLTPPGERPTVTLSGVETYQPHSSEITLTALVSQAAPYAPTLLQYDVNGGEPSVVSITKRENPIKIKKLASGQQYTVRVIVMNENGASEPALATFMTTKALQVSLTSSDTVAVTQPTTTTAELVFSASGEFPIQLAITPTEHFANFDLANFDWPNTVIDEPDDNQTVIYALPFDLAQVISRTADSSFVDPPACVNQPSPFNACLNLLGFSRPLLHVPENSCREAPVKYGQCLLARERALWDALPAPPAQSPIAQNFVIMAQDRYGIPQKNVIPLKVSIHYAAPPIWLERLKPHSWIVWFNLCVLFLTLLALWWLGRRIPLAHQASFELAIINRGNLECPYELWATQVATDSSDAIDASSRMLRFSFYQDGREMPPIRAVSKRPKLAAAKPTYTSNREAPSVPTSVSQTAAEIDYAIPLSQPAAEKPVEPQPFSVQHSAPSARDPYELTIGQSQHVETHSLAPDQKLTIDVKVQTRRLQLWSRPYEFTIYAESSAPNNWFCQKLTTERIYLGGLRRPRLAFKSMPIRPEKETPTRMEQRTAPIGGAAE